MATGRIHSASVSNVAYPVRIGKLHSAQISSTATAVPIRGRVHSAKVTATVPPAVVQGYLHSAKMTASPKIDPGYDQTVEPWSQVTLQAVDVPDPVNPYVWTQESGPAVVLSGEGSTRTYEAPAGIEQLILVFRVTYGSSTDTVTHTVLPVTERAVIGGVEVPMRII